MGCKYVPEELKRAARKEFGAASEKDIVQADFTQNDATDLSYIKNRPFYKVDVTDVSVVNAMREPIDLMQEQIGSIFRLSGKIGHPGFVTYIGKDSIGWHIIMHYETQYTMYTDMNPVSTDIVFGGPGFRYGMLQPPNRSYPYKVEYIVIDSSNSTLASTMCKVTVAGIHIFNIYIIWNPSKLLSDYADKFTESGIYLEYVAKPSTCTDYFRVSFAGIFATSAIDACHLPTQVEYNYYKVNEITDDNKDSTDLYPSIAAVEKRLQLTSPDGSKWMLSIADDGTLSATKIEA